MFATQQYYEWLIDSSYICIKLHKILHIENNAGKTNNYYTKTNEIE